MFELNTEQRAIIGQLKEFLTAEVLPGALERDKTGAFPHDLVEQGAEMGLFGLQIPEEYGGSALDSTTAALIIEEIAAVDGSFALTVASHNSLAVGHLLHGASDAQKEQWLPDLASGKSLGAWALTEPAAGSDAASLQTKAEKDGDEYVLNGSKLFITQGTVGNTYVVNARTAERERGVHDGISTFVFAGDTPGLLRGKPEDKLGLKSSDTTPLTFENLRVHERQLVGELNRGFETVLKVLDGGRIGIGAMGIGLGREALEIAARYVSEREQFGRPLVRNQGVSFQLAKAATDLEAARLLVLKAAHLRDAGKDYSLAAAMAKLRGSVAGVDACDMAIQLLGGNGYMTDYVVERLWRDARLTRIGEGTDEIQHLIIAREYLRSLGV